MSDEIISQGEVTPAPIPAAAGQLLSVKQGMWSAGTGDTSGFDGIVRSTWMPAGSQPPFGDWYDAAVARVAELVESPYDRVVFDRGELTLYVRAEKLVEVAQVLRDDAQLRFEYCISVSGVHYPNEAGAQLHSVIHLQSITHNRRLRVETSASEENPHIPSVVSVYPAADWHEREAWDMFGIVYDGHPHLTRILMPDDWVGHPQRKDYPLGGIAVEFKGAKVPPVEERRRYQ
ncbi:MAG: NADH-quinone oxidoreductase subunit C [Propionibacteriaceae bacterium]|jgi:NADH-quinone oxidoreductase subunit C|nr:NADH-quinone oxidoreductase subunit C [Propionibacteriaceae bacterium]